MKDDPRHFQIVQLQFYNMRQNAIGNSFIPPYQRPDQQQQSQQQAMEPFLGHQIAAGSRDMSHAGIAVSTSHKTNMSMMSQSGVDGDRAASQISNIDQSKSSKVVNGGSRRNGMRGKQKADTRPRTSKIEGQKLNKYASTTSIGEIISKPTTGKRSLQLLMSNQPSASSSFPMNPLNQLDKKSMGKKTPSISESRFEPQDERQELRIKGKQSSGSKKTRIKTGERRMGMRERREKEGPGNEVGKGRPKLQMPHAPAGGPAQETGSSDQLHASNNVRLQDMEPFSGSSIEERNKKSVIGLGTVLADKESSSKKSPFKTYQGTDGMQMTSVEKDRDLVNSTKKTNNHRSFGGTAQDNQIMSDKKSNITSNTGVHSPMVPPEDLQGDVRKRMDNQRQKLDFRGTGHNPQSVDLNMSKVSLNSITQKKHSTRPKSKGKYTITTYQRVGGNLSEMRDHHGSQSSGRFAKNNNKANLKKMANNHTALQKHKSHMGFADEMNVHQQLPVQTAQMVHATESVNSFNAGRVENSKTIVIPRSTKNLEDGAPKFDFNRNNFSRLSQGSIVAPRSIKNGVVNSGIDTSRSKKQLSKSRSLLQIRDLEISKEKSSESRDAANKEGGGVNDQKKNGTSGIAGFFDNAWNAIFARDSGQKDEEERKEGEIDGEQEDVVNDVLITGEFKRRASRDSLVQFKGEAKRNRLDLNMSRENAAKASKRHAESHPGVKSSMASHYGVTQTQNEPMVIRGTEDDFNQGLAQIREDSLRQPLKTDKDADAAAQEEGFGLALLKQSKSSNMPQGALDSSELQWIPKHRNQHAKKENARKMSHIVDQPDPDSDSCDVSMRNLQQKQAAAAAGAQGPGGIDSAYASSITSGLQSNTNGGAYESRLTNRKNINQNVSLAKAGQGMLPDNSAFPLSATKKSARSRSGAEYNVGEDDEDSAPLDDYSLASKQHQILGTEVQWKQQVQVMKQNKDQSSGPPKLERTAGLALKTGPGNPEKQEPVQDGSEMIVKNRRDSKLSEQMVPGSAGRVGNARLMLSGGPSATRRLAGGPSFQQRQRNPDNGSLAYLLGSGKSLVSSTVGPMDDTVAYDQKFTQFHRPEDERNAIRIREEQDDERLRRSPRNNNSFAMKHRGAKVIEIDLDGLEEGKQNVRNITLNEHAGVRSAYAQSDAGKFSFAQDQDRHPGQVGEGAQASGATGRPPLDPAIAAQQRRLSGVHPGGRGQDELEVRSAAGADDSIASGAGFAQQQSSDVDAIKYSSGRQRHGTQASGKYLLKSKSPNTRGIQLQRKPSMLHERRRNNQNASSGPADRTGAHRDRSHGPALLGPPSADEYQVRSLNQTRKVQDFSANRGHREGLAWAGAGADGAGGAQTTAVDDIVSFFKGMFVAQPEDRQHESDGKPRYQLQRGRHSAETKASSSQSALAQQRNRMNAASRANHNGWSPQEVLERFSGEGPECLTAFEEIELGNYERIYTIGSVRRSNQYSIADQEGFYKVQVGEQLGYRYEVKRLIDKGSFGQVIMCVDMKDERQRVVAVKIGKNKKFDVDNAQVEVRILKKLKTKDPNKNSHYHEGYDRIVEYLDSFNFRQHVVIVFEYLHFNLYKFMKVNKLKRPTFDPKQLRRIVYQVSQGLRWMKQNTVIHCDMKPENIIFTDENYRNVKIIDFGASCQDYSSGFFYVQSRYYRAPEIVLGNKYDSAVDIWSLGCIVYELITGRPLFPAKDENELLEYFMVTLGDMPQEMYVGCKKYKQFYRSATSFLGYESHELIRSKDSAFDPRRDLPVGQQPVRWLLDKHMKQDQQPEVDPRAISFIERCLVYDPQQRMTPEEALQHDWFYIHKEVATKTLL